MNVVLYLRYSSDKQTEQSIEGQERICRQYCERNDMRIVDVYIDRALSASKNTEKRVSFQKMIKDSERGGWEAVVVYKLDRFARNRYDSATYKNRLKRNGVKVLSATENITDSPESIILESVLEGMAEFYSQELAQKVTRGMRETALKCNSCGCNVPLGYMVENKKIVENPVTSPIVTEAFERYANGETMASICDDFNARGFRTSKGSVFNKNSFRSMFKNERYIGVYEYKDIRIEGGVPSIVSKEIFDAVQERLKTNAAAPAKSKAKIRYLLSGKLFCGHCGELMTGESGNGRHGTKHHYYTCSSRKRFHSCDKKAIRKEALEIAVVEDVLQILTQDVVDEIADMAVKQAELEVEENVIIPALEAELHDTDKSINNLLRLVEQGSTSPSLFKRLDELEDIKKSLESRIEEEAEQFVALEKEHVAWWLSQFVQGDVNDEEFRRKIIDMLVNSVTVWDEPDGYKITILCNLQKNNTRTFRVSDFARQGPPIKKHPLGCFFVGRHE